MNDNYSIASLLYSTKTTDKLIVFDRKCEISNP